MAPSQRPRALAKIVFLAIALGERILTQQAGGVQAGRADVQAETVAGRRFHQNAGIGGGRQGGDFRPFPRWRHDGRRRRVGVGEDRGIVGKRRGGADPGIRMHRRPQQLEPTGKHHRVAVQQHHVGAAGVAQPGIRGGRKTHVAAGIIRAGRDQSNGAGSCERHQRRDQGRLRRAVIHHHHPVGGADGGDHRPHTVQRGLHAAIDRDHHGDGLSAGWKRCGGRRTGCLERASQQITLVASGDPEPLIGRQRDLKPAGPGERRRAADINRAVRRDNGRALPILLDGQHGIGFRCAGMPGPAHGPLWTTRHHTFNAMNGAQIDRAAKSGDAAEIRGERRRPAPRGRQPEPPQIIPLQHHPLAVEPRYWVGTATGDQPALAGDATPGPAGYGSASLGQADERGINREASQRLRQVTDRIRHPPQRQGGRRLADKNLAHGMARGDPGQQIERGREIAIT